MQNQTLKNNILFGQPYDEDKYRNVISACCLDDDIAVLPGGNETEIGERGITLSGGQKQRISIARACYSGRDVFILDDPLSALDMHVGQAVLYKCFTGWMKGTTRVLVTNHLHFLHLADKIVVLNKQVPVFVGTYDELNKSDIDLGSFVTQHQEPVDESSDSSTTTETTTTTTTNSTTTTTTPDDKATASASIVQETAKTPQPKAVCPFCYFSCYLCVVITFVFVVVVVVVNRRKES